MKKLLILCFIFFNSLSWAQSTDSKSDTTVKTYAVQVFSTVSELKAINEGSTLLDECIIERVNVKGKVYYRAIIQADDLLKAEELCDRYKETYKDCFIVEYRNNKRIN